VSKPKLTSIDSFFKSPSIVFGHPITFVELPLAKKYSAKSQALVLESSPPITTKPSSCNYLQLFSALALSFSEWILSLPDS